MAHGRPWYKRKGGNFLMAVMHFPDIETKWGYSAIIDMLNDRDRSIPDDAGFICGFTGLTRKKWSIVRNWLLSNLDSNEEFYLVAMFDGTLTNPRFERERAQRLTAREEAIEHGREGGKKSAALRARQGDLDFEEGDEPVPARARARTTPKKPDSTRDSPPEGRADSPPKGVEKGPDVKSKSNDLAEPPPQAPCARKRREVREDSTLPDSEECGPDRLADADLQTLFDAVCEASGHRPISPAQIDRAYRHVEEWRKAGFDFDLVIIPTIKAVVASTSEPTRTLGRFDARIRHEQARLKAQPVNGTYRPPPSPVLDVEGEDPAMRPIRVDLLERLGVRAYAIAANDVRLEAVADAGAGRRPLRVIDNRAPALRLMDGERVAIVKAVALRHGFTEVW